MRTPCVFRLSFLLPPALGLLVAPGRQQPCLHGCILTLDALGRITIEGSSKAAVFAQCRRFLVANSKGQPAYATAATLDSPLPWRGRDDWSIIVGAEVAFSPTPLGPEI